MQTETPAQPPAEPTPTPTEPKEAVESPAPQKATESKKPKKKNEKKERPPRPPRERKYVYVEPENWREELKKTVTLETKAPPQRKKADLMKKPDREDLKKKLNKKNAAMDKKRKEIKALFEEKDKIRDQERQKNNEGYSLFLKLKAEKEKAWDSLDKLRNKVKWKNLREKQTKKRDRLRALMDKSVFKGIAKNMVQAKKHIAKLKMEFRDMKKTAKEEKLMTDKISKYEKGLGHFEKVDTIQKQLDELRTKMDSARKQLDPLEKAFKTARYKFNKNNEEFKKKKEAEKEKNGGEVEEKPKGKDKEKKVRVLSEAEQQIVKKVQKVRDAIGKLREEKNLIFDEFDKQMMEYRQDHFEFAKANETNRILKRLKHEENQRKWEENKAKREEEALQKLKDARKEIFTEELEKINSVNGALQLLKLDKDRAHMMKAQDQVEDSGEKPNIDLESENLELMVSKKVAQGYENRSKKNKKRQKKNKIKNKVNLAMVKSNKGGKSLLPADITVTLREMRVEPPTDLSQVEDVIKAVAGKREEYLKLRERYVNEEKFEGVEAEMVVKAEANMKQGENWEGEEGEIREKKREKKPKTNKSQKKKAVVEDNGENFPSL